MQLTLGLKIKINILRINYLKMQIHEICHVSLRNTSKRFVARVVMKVETTSLHSVEPGGSRLSSG